MENKRGQGLSVNAMILIVLGIAILILLIVGFRAGYSRLLPIINPPQNVQSVIDKCGSVCVLGGKYDYCNVNRELKTEDDMIITLNDSEKTEINFGKAMRASCYEIQFAFGKALGMANCPALVGQCEDITYSTKDFATVACDRVETKGTQITFAGGEEPITC